MAGKPHPSQWFCAPDDLDPLGCFTKEVEGLRPCSRCCGWTSDESKWAVLASTSVAEDGA